MVKSLTPDPHRNGWGQKQVITGVGEDGEKSEPSYAAGENAEWCSHSGKQSRSSSKGSTQRSRGLGQATLKDSYPRETKPHVHTTACPQMFTAALCTPFTAYVDSPKWKQPKCPPTDGLTNRMPHIHTVDYHSAVKRSEVQVLATP